ncbi:hypothetical protein LOK49_LG10G01790 [Camellia lanceoleosa]|uniref:Uncharacterized protein n=1 Tax=Camellia lanceoleosa TaxID=1840588 RepID=A0ACC0GB93_9ERIC|nr:hypothetical protein LOK49_LG10G01790 [Camellia lanceoleosa]
MSNSMQHKFWVFSKWKFKDGINSLLQFSELIPRLQWRKRKNRIRHIDGMRRLLGTMTKTVIVDRQMDDDVDRGDHDRCRRCNDDDDCWNLERDRRNGGEDDDGGLPEPVVLVINVSP